MTAQAGPGSITQTGDGMGILQNWKKMSREIDWSLVFVILFLSLFGLIMIYSASYYSAYMKLGDGSFYVKRQAEFLAVGLVFMAAATLVDYHVLLKHYMLWIVLVTLLMILVDFTPFGIEFNGKKRWFGIGGHSLFQPTELVKIAVILAAVMILYYAGKGVIKSRTIIAFIMICGPCTLLVAINNLSSGLIIAGILFVMMFVASPNRRFFAGIILLLLFLAFSAVTLSDSGILQQYQASRIMVWQHPEQYLKRGGWQVMQGLYAIGSGGLFGKGLGGGVQKLGFVPEAQNDMIFAIICEELGVFGAICVILLFLFMIWRFVMIAINAPDRQGLLLVTGVMAQISLQVILNIAVVTNFIPNTGVSLPFISYGGTSLVFLMVEMGMVLSVSARSGVRAGAVNRKNGRRRRSASVRAVRRA